MPSGFPPMTPQELAAIRERDKASYHSGEWSAVHQDRLELLAHIDAITEAERRRLADALRRYFEDGPSTFRSLLDYIDLDYATAQLEGWLDFNNAIVRHDAKVASGERE